MATLHEEFTALIAEFHRRQIPYAVCGGWAMAIHGTLRATIDIDLMVQANDLERARSAAKELGYKIEGQPLEFRDGGVQIRRLSKVDRETEELITVDFLLVTEVTQDVWKNRNVVEWEQRKISVVSREGLIQMKRLAGRLQDLADIERLENER